MTLSYAISMVEEWLSHNTYSYKIYKVEELESTWKISFYEYSPLGNIDCETFFEVPFEKRCIFNAFGNEVLSLGRDAYSSDNEMMEWFERFEKRWNYEPKKKVTVFYTKLIEVEALLDQEDIDKFAVDGPPDWVNEKADKIDDKQPLVVEGFRVADEKGE